MTQLIRVMTLAVLSTVFFGVLSTVALGADKSAASSQATRGDNDSLTDQMQQLSGGSSSEKFYVVHDRRSGNAGVFDISAGAGYNTNSDVNIRSSEQMARINYHATDKVFLSVAGSQVHNQFNLSAQKRMEEDGTFPNVGFVKSRVDLSIGYNLIYGKARVSKDAIFYFDQYVAIGGGVINQTNTREEVKTPAAPAMAEPIAKVKERIASIFTPISDAATGLRESARIAIPVLVCKTTVRRTSSRMRVDPTTITCPMVTVRVEKIPHEAGRSIAASAMISGKACGSAPNRYCPPLSRRSETPIAVIRTVRRGCCRSGR